MIMVQRRHQLPFGIRLLLLTMFAIVLGSLWLENETSGRLVLLGKQPSPQAPVVHVFEPHQIARLQESLEVALERHASTHGVARPDFELKEIELEDYRFLTVDHERWVRRRLDLGQFDYVLDDSDPVAELYNQQLDKTVESVAYDSYNSARP